MKFRVWDRGRSPIYRYIVDGANGSQKLVFSNKSILMLNMLKHKWYVYSVPPFYYIEPDSYVSKEMLESFLNL